MPNFVKATPIGIDVNIQNLQTVIYETISGELGISGDDWNSYGRTYRLFDNEGKEYLPYPFDRGYEYKNPALFEDTVKLQSFFDILETQKIGNDCQATCKVVYYVFANLELIFGSKSDRLDEKLSSIFASFVQQQFGFNLHSKRIGIKTIMKDWNGYTKENISQSNKQPLYAFALEFEISSYYICYDNPILRNVQLPTTLIIPPNGMLAPTGIDQCIEKCRIYLFNYLLSVFNNTIVGYGILLQKDYISYPRIYRQECTSSEYGKEYIPQAFLQIKNGSIEYRNVLFEDTCSIQSFFDVGETMREQSNSLLSYVNIKIYFFVDLSKLYLTGETRMDEEFIILISQFLMENSGFEMIGIDRGIKAIMNEYNGYKIKMNSKANMQPLLCFRCDMKKYFDESFDNCPQLIN